MDTDENVHRYGIPIYTFIAPFGDRLRATTDYRERSGNDPHPKRERRRVPGGTAAQEPVSHHLRENHGYDDLKTDGQQ